MDDLTQRALSNLNSASAHYNDKQQREAEQQTLTEAPAFVKGFAGGKYLVERLGQEPTATGVAVTNGLLQTGRRVTTTGQFVDGVPRVKPVQPVVATVEATGKIKYLFTTTDSEFTYLYIGGHQPQPQLVTKLPIGQPITAAKLDNLPGKRYQVSLAIQNEFGTELIFATTGFNVVSTFKTLVSFIRPVGAGFWVTAATKPFLPNYLSATSVNGYYSFLTDQTGNPELNNKVDSFYRDRVLATAFSRATDLSTGNSAFSGSLYLLPDLQVDQSLNDIIQFRDFYNVKRVDAKGLHGYAVHSDSNFSGAPSWVDQAHGAVKYPDEIAPTNGSYIDVFANKFSLMNRSDIDIAQNKTITVTLYSPTFQKQGTSRVKVFKQSISLDARLLDVSYSP